MAAHDNYPVVRKVGRRKGETGGPVAGTRKTTHGTVVSGVAKTGGDVVAAAHKVGERLSVRNRKGGS